jgi:hypothetical protein
MHSTQTQLLGRQLAQLLLLALWGGRTAVVGQILLLLLLF